MQLSELLENERATHQRALDEQWSELAGKHAGERKGEFSTIGKAHAVTGRDESGEVTVTDESHGFLQTETPEQRLDRPRHGQ